MAIQFESSIEVVGSASVFGSAYVESLSIGNFSGQISNRIWFDTGGSPIPGLYFEGGQPKFIIYSSVSSIFHDTYHPNADTWTTARTITIGNTGKSVNGSANVSWSLAEIGAVSGSGTTNYVAKWSDTDTITDSVIYDNGTNVGIGTTSASDRLEVAAANSQLRLRDTDDNNFAQFSYSSGKLVVRNNSTTTTVNQFTLDSIGRMGIGTTSPNSKLEVAGDTSNALLTLKSLNGGTNDAFMRFYDESNGPSYSMGLDSSDEKFKIAYNSDGDSLTIGTKLVMETSGNVAIGATTAIEKLVVSGNAWITNNVYIGSGNTLKTCTYSAQYSLVVGQSNTLGGIANGIIGVSNTIDCTNEPWSSFGGNFIAGKNNTINNLYSHANAVFGQNNTVGDPTTPSNSVAGILVSGVGHSTFGNNSFAFGESCFTDISATRSLTGGYDSNNFGQFGSVAIGAGATASTGNNQYAFGTGVTTPTSASFAYGSDQFVVGKYNEYTNASSVPHRFAVGNGTQDASRDTPFCVIGGGTYTNGQVSINDADGFAYSSVPYSVFHVNGRATSSYSSSFTFVSDERVKKNIVNYSKGLAEIIQVQPKSYTFNGKANTVEGIESIGVLAQEIKEVFPETVGTVAKKLNPEDEQETELYAVDISPVTYALINAVKELNAKVEALEARIQTLEGN